MKRVTLADVAAIAGVSVKTVSHVLSGNPTVRLPETTRAKVREAADQVGYRANRLAQAMQSGRTDLISVWIPLERLLPVYQEYLYQLSLRAQASDKGLLVSGVGQELAYAGQGETPKSWPVDGMIVIDAGKSINSFRDDSRNNQIPLSILGFEQFTNADSVGWDVALSSYQVNKSMLDSGCKSIVHISHDWVLADYPREQRRRGYAEAMEEAGLEPVFIGVKGDSSQAAREAFGEYLESNPVPEGVSSFNDRLAIGAILALESRGCKVPQDCQVWGFGDMPESRSWPTPVSSIRTPTVEIIEQAWTWLLERIDDPSIEPRLASIAMEILPRGTSR